MNDITGLQEILQKALSERGYTLIRNLSGNSGQRFSNAEVWLANYQPDGADSREVALKIFSRLHIGKLAMNDGLKLKELGEREISITDKLDHPNIPCQVANDSFTLNSFANIDLLASNYIDAPNLLERIENRKTINEDKAKIILADILGALDYVHTLDEQVLHRDIKPSNILFDDKKAYLFDFNFSQLGEKTTSFTVIDNYGYYPVDSYSGRQTPSQDLCALGNVVIALAEGKDISLIRNQQKVGALDAVNVEELNFSTKLKMFLRKLTTNNAALRYQNASQALTDLRTLDQISEEDMGAKMDQITRDSQLQRTLDRLQKEDRLFDYNVPANVLSTYDDGKLFDHLQNAYDRDQFIISVPEEIEKYARIHDRVVKKGDQEFVTINIKKGAVGKIQSVNDSEEIISVEFKGNRNGYNVYSIHNVSPLEIEVYSRKTGWFTRSKVEPSERGDKTTLRISDFVKYIGDDIKYKDRLFVPDETQGIIGRDYNENKIRIYKIMWADASGLVEESEPFNWKFKAYDFKLVIPNRIDFQELYDECATLENNE